jgi:hypothetical protein
MTDEALFRSVTATAAAVWRLTGHGVLEAGSRADVVVAKRIDIGGDDLAAWFEINPVDIMLVMHDGKIVLADESRYRQLQETRSDVSSLSKITVQGSVKYVYGDLPGLMAQIKSHAPEAVFPVEC